MPGRYTEEEKKKIRKLPGNIGYIGTPEKSAVEKQLDKISKPPPNWLEAMTGAKPVAPEKPEKGWLEKGLGFVADVAESGLTGATEIQAKKEQDTEDEAYQAREEDYNAKLKEWSKTSYEKLGEKRRKGIATEEEVKEHKKIRKKMGYGKSEGTGITSSRILDLLKEGD